MAFLLRRVPRSIIMILVIASAVFFMLRLSSGDPARIRGSIYANEEVIEQYRRDFGIDRPIFEQYANFFYEAIQGNLGESYRFQAPVTELIGNAFPQTLMLAGAALILSMITAFVLGSLAALKPDSPWTWFSSSIAALGQSAPVFWSGAILVLIFSVGLGWLPAGGYSGAASLVLPAIAVMFSILPTQLRVLRASMEAVLQEEYIITSRAFGIGLPRIVFVHALRNAILPLLTVVGVDVGYLLGGVIVAEAVFAFPGIGQLALTALNSRDYPLIQGITIVSASAFVFVNVVIDILYTIIDPRIRTEMR